MEVMLSINVINPTVLLCSFLFCFILLFKANFRVLVKDNIFVEKII